MPGPLAYTSQGLGKGCAFLLTAEEALRATLDALLARAAEEGGAGGGNGGNGGAQGGEASAAEVARQEALVTGACYLLPSQAFYRCARWALLSPAKP